MFGHELEWHALFFFILSALSLVSGDRGPKKPNKTFDSDCQVIDFW